VSGKVFMLRPGPAAVADLTDDALLAECARGSGAALAELFDRYHVAVRGFLSRTPGADARDLDDLVQITFETVPGAARRFDGRAAVHTGMCGVAYNVVRHHIRGEVRRRRIVAAAAAERRADVVDASAEALARERAGRLRAAILELPPKLRETFVYVYLEGIQGREVAELLGIPEGTVWKRLHQARARLRTKLEGVYR
jgi:RNA polymerase sigma-70 factor (ECF subfamily)